MEKINNLDRKIDTSNIFISHDILMEALKVIFTKNSNKDLYAAVAEKFDLPDSDVKNEINTAFEALNFIISAFTAQEGLPKKGQSIAYKRIVDLRRTYKLRCKRKTGAEFKERVETLYKLAASISSISEIVHEYHSRNPLEKVSTSYIRQILLYHKTILDKLVKDGLKIEKDSFLDAHKESLKSSPRARKHRKTSENDAEFAKEIAKFGMMSLVDKVALYITPPEKICGLDQIKQQIINRRIELGVDGINAERSKYGLLPINEEMAAEVASL